MMFEMEAARLIMAGPDLLAALQGCLSDLVDIVRAEGGDESCTMKAAMAAIEKATGN